MSPTIVTKKGKPILALGSPGGSKIISTVAQGIINITRMGLHVQAAVAQPRFHHQWLPDTLFMEEGGFDESTKQSLTIRGHTIGERSKYSELHLIYIDESGLLCGAADPRAGGSAGGY
jgi:gamma-glutamyltranspeptidase/glutathione hydrolase